MYQYYKFIIGFCMFAFTYANCFEINNQIDCQENELCEWHADEMACEEAGDDHDHEHCDELAESECEASDHCEWHADHCEDAHGDSDCDDTDHFNTDGLILESHGSEIYSQFQGLIEGSVEVHMNEAEDFSLHFLDSSGNEIEVTDADCYPLSFNVTDPSIISITMEEGHDDHDHGDDHDNEHGALSFEINGLAVGSTTFTISIMHQGHADYTSMPILVTVHEEETCVAGDTNIDGILNIVDVVNLVTIIIDADQPEEECAYDLNEDGIINVVDVIWLVNHILNSNSRLINATHSNIVYTDNKLSVNGNGFIQGIQMTLSHASDFSIELADEYIAEYASHDNNTTLVIVTDGSKSLSEIARISGEYTIDSVIVVDSNGTIIPTQQETEITTFELNSAYPNPFNPTTNIVLSVSETSYISVKIYNLAGQEIATLADGVMNANTYTLTWDASTMSSCVYLVRAESFNQISTQKIMLIK